MTLQYAKKYPVTFESDTMIIKAKLEYSKTQNKQNITDEDRYIYIEMQSVPQSGRGCREAMVLLFNG